MILVPPLKKFGAPSGMPHYSISGITSVSGEQRMLCACYVYVTRPKLSRLFWDSSFVTIDLTMSTSLNEVVNVIIFFCPEVTK